MAFQTLETDNLILRPLSAKDAGDYGRLAQMFMADDQALAVYLMNGKPFQNDTAVGDVETSLREAEYIDKLLTANQEIYFLQSQATNEFVGYMGLYEDRNGNQQFTIFTLPSHRRAGYMSEAYPVIAEHIRRNGIKVDHAEVLAGPDEKASLTLLFNDGFKIEETVEFASDPNPPTVYNPPEAYHKLVRG